MQRLVAACEEATRDATVRRAERRAAEARQAAAVGQATRRSGRLAAARGVADAQRRATSSIAGGKRKSESETQQRDAGAEEQPRKRERAGRGPDAQRGTKRAMGIGRGDAGADGPLARRARGAVGRGEGGTSRGGGFMTRSQR